MDQIGPASAASRAAPFLPDQPQLVANFCHMSPCDSISSIAGGPFSPDQAQHVAQLRQMRQNGQSRPASAASQAEELMQLPPSASVDEREIIARLHAESENVAERSSWGGAGTAAA